MKKNILAIVLCVALIATMTACGSEVSTSTEKPTDTSVETVTSTPTVEPTEASTETPAEETAATPTEEATTTPTEEPATTPTEEVTVTPVEEPATTPTEEVTVTPVEEPATTPIEEATVTPTEESTATPAEEPTVTPTEETTTTTAEEVTDTPTKEAPADTTTHTTESTLTYVPTWIGETQTYNYKGMTFEFPAQNNCFDKIVEAGYADRDVWDGTVIWLNEDDTAGFIYLRNTNTTKNMGSPYEDYISDDEFNAWWTKILEEEERYEKDPKKAIDLDGNGIITSLEADFLSIFTIGIDMNGFLTTF